MDIVVVPLRSDEDVVRLRQAVRNSLVSIGFSLVDQTKLITAASELARNTVKYGGGGEAHLARVANGMRTGVSLVFVDQGPGIANIEEAMADGFTSGGGLGLGLGGAKRLSDEFDMQSAVGKGTTVRITKWKPF
ncbi:anti-sigma regulatory factor [Noviherbaspirillum sp.]|uniref:anti-sigma regulatory factor n=1 Tax=Noviherbaspirillum sp. TaxID=1926288 RepID=UPI002D449CDF|nr:anti-sigma regulatory factor [Noviherbaspirillum sp.]HZW20189.1 anti-sigma regulatory factor [Noviherbaspirillum sp.]